MEFFLKTLLHQFLSKKQTDDCKNELKAGRRKAVFLVSFNKNRDLSLINRV